MEAHDETTAAKAAILESKQTHRQLKRKNGNFEQSKILTHFFRGRLNREHPRPPKDLLSGKQAV